MLRQSGWTSFEHHLSLKIWHMNYNLCEWLLNKTLIIFKENFSYFILPVHVFDMTPKGDKAWFLEHLSWWWAFVSPHDSAWAPVCSLLVNGICYFAGKFNHGKLPMTAAGIRVTCAERKVDLGLSPWRRPSCQRPMDFIHGLNSDTELPRLWRKLEHG